MEDTKYTASQATAIAIVAPFIVVMLSVATFPLTIFCAWCDRFIWNWFAAPYFHLSPMSLWVAVGIGLWIRLQTFSSKIVKGEKTETIRPIFIAVVFHAISVGLAYIVHTRWQ